jgi:hypothetical protein
VEDSGTPWAIELAATTRNHASNKMSAQNVRGPYLLLMPRFLNVVFTRRQKKRENQPELSVLKGFKNFRKFSEKYSPARIARRNPSGKTSACTHPQSVFLGLITHQIDGFEVRV